MGTRVLEQFAIGNIIPRFLEVDFVVQVSPFPHTAGAMSSNHARRCSCSSARVPGGRVPFKW